MFTVPRLAPSEEGGGLSQAGLCATANKALSFCLMESSDSKTSSYRGSNGAIRLQDVIQRFSGDKPGEDITVWRRQVRLVARLQNLGDLSAVVPLFLDGPALAVYEQMSDTDQGDVETIFDHLTRAFSVDIFEAYHQFKSRVRQQGEAVDVFLSELRRLGSLAGINSDDLLRVAFVTGLLMLHIITIHASILFINLFSLKKFSLYMYMVRDFWDTLYINQ